MFKLTPILERRTLRIKGIKREKIMKRKEFLSFLIN